MGMLTVGEGLQQASFEKRLGAFLIDHFILTMVLVMGFMYIAWDSFENEPEQLFRLFPMFMLVAFVVYCSKDIFGGASLGKLTVGLAVRCSDDVELTPSGWNLFYRNVLSFLWPVELIALLCSRNKRKIGDNLAGTDVYSVSRKTKTAVIVVVAVLLVASFVFALVFGITAILKNDASYLTAISYIEASEEIKSVVGNITGYGFFVQGSLSISNGYGEADYYIRVIGDAGELSVAVRLERKPGMEWEIIDVLH